MENDEIIVENREWITRLFDTVKSHQRKTDEERECEIRDEMDRIYENDGKKESEPLLAIPRFFAKKDKLNSTQFGQMVRGVTFSKAQEDLSNGILNEDDLKHIAMIIEGVSEINDDGSHRINYDHFAMSADGLSTRVQHFFSSQKFLRFRRDELGRIDGNLFFQYVSTYKTLLNQYLDLMAFDLDSSGRITEVDLEEYFQHLIDTVPTLQSLQNSFHPFYRISCVKILSFFVKKAPKTNTMKIIDILASPMFEQLIELLELDHPKDPPTTPCNPFFPVNALQIYSSYIRLDTDKNGLISREEMQKFGSGQLAPTFIDNVFGATNLYVGGELDYKGYLQLYIAMRYKNTPTSIKWLFRRLTGGEDVLEKKEMLYLIQEALKHQDTNFSDLDEKQTLIELLDMLAPQNINYITVKDFLDCKIGGYVIANIIDFSALTKHACTESIKQLEDMELQENNELQNHHIRQGIYREISLDEFMFNDEDGEIQVPNEL